MSSRTSNYVPSFSCCGPNSEIETFPIEQQSGSGLLRCGMNTSILLSTSWGYVFVFLFFLWSHRII